MASARQRRLWPCWRSIRRSGAPFRRGRRRRRGCRLTNYDRRDRELGVAIAPEHVGRGLPAWAPPATARSKTVIHVRRVQRDYQAHRRATQRRGRGAAAMPGNSSETKMTTESPMRSSACMISRRGRACG